MFEKCMFEKCMFEKCIFEKCSFEKCNFEKCIFEKCIFEKCIFEKCIFEKCIFEKYLSTKVAAAPLPEGWTQATAPDGRIFYYHSVTKERQWAHPGGHLSLAKLAKFEIFCKILQIFGGLVLGCIKTKFCKKICVRQHFSSSTRFAYFSTFAPLQNFSKKSA